MGQETSKLVGLTPARQTNAVRRLSRIVRPFGQANDGQAMWSKLGKLKSRKSSTANTDGHEQLLHRRLSIVKTRVRHVENFITVCLGPNIDVSNKDYHESINELLKNVNIVHQFTDADECIDYIKTIENEKVFMIVSGGLDQPIMTDIHEMAPLESVYVLCDDKSKYEQWVKEFRKVKGVFTGIEPLCNALHQNIQQLESRLLPMSILSSPSTSDLKEIDHIFVLSQLLKIILSESDCISQAKEDFADFCRVQYVESNQVLDIIDEFERDYDHQSPIWWYTRDCFICPVLNKALKIQDIEIIMKMAFFIRDLNRQIGKLNSESDNRHQYTVYRGQSMPKNRFEELNNSKSGLFSFNNFVSAIADREISLKFARYDRDNPDLIGILFQIEIYSSMSSVMFTTVDKENYFSEQVKRVLFSMHTTFQIGEITQIENGLYQVNLTLVNENDPQLARIIGRIQGATGESNGWNRIGKLLMEMGNFDKAEEMYLALLRMTPGDNGKERAFLQYQLGYINEQKGNWSRALSRYEQCLEIRLTYLAADDPQLAPINTDIGWILYKQGEFKRALEHFQFSLNVELHTLHPNQLKIGTHHSNIGTTHFALENYAEALEHFEKTLELYFNHLSDRESMINIHHNLAITYEVLKRSKESIEHAEHAFEIARQTFGRNNPFTQKQQEYLDTLRTEL